MDRLVVGRLVGVLVAVVSLVARGQVPEWIWSHGGGSADGEVCHAVKSFGVAGKVSKATLEVSCDNHAVVFVNGEKVGASGEWNAPVVVDAAKLLKVGENVLAVQGKNDGGVAALIARLTVVVDGKTSVVVSDASWAVSRDAGAGWEKPGFDVKGWGKPASFGKLGSEPWGAVLGGAPGKPGKGGGGKAATAAESLAVVEGFKVELIRNAEAGEGSWVSMAVDGKGRLYISPQSGEPVLRFTLDANGQVAKKDTVPAPIKGAMGMLWVKDALYFNGNGPEGHHLYRVTDSDGDDALDKPELLVKWGGGPGEHGTHGVVLGPDNKLYIVCGNFVKLPEGVLPTSPFQHYAGDDLALPRAEDGNGFGSGEKMPAGYVVRMDLDGKNVELVGGGQRNNYDIGFNVDGELFGFDSDMEWDWGTPWYRPTRVFHITSGADHGYRGGSGKWPEWYQDSMPAVVNIGVGSPTGVRFGTGAKFPEKYQRALYIMDWTYGRLMAVHLTPQGASYGGSFENFVAGKPLNVTDLEVGADGAMYFTVGGRGTQSGLYRVSYTGGDSTKLADTRDKAGADSRALRHELEKFHGRADAKAVAFAWPHLDSPDRTIRFAARVAIEFQPAADWKAKALAETNTDAALTALLALARVGPKETQDEILEALRRFPMTQLTEERQLLKLRVIEVSIARQGKPAARWTPIAAEKLLPLYPANSDALNRELCQVLLAMDVPGTISKTLALARTARSQEQQLFYLFNIRTATNGWTHADRLAWFSWFSNTPTDGGIVPVKKQGADPEKWFADVGRTPSDGSSFGGFVRNLRKAGVATLSDQERFDLAGILTEPLGASKPRNAKKPLAFVKAWTMADFEADLDRVGKGRNIAKGKEAYESAMCLMCHKYGNEGGGVGNDLTAIASRFSRRDILESIMDPSKVVSEQLAFTTVTKKDGTQITGRIADDNAQKVSIIINPLAPDVRVDIPADQIAKREHSKISPMPSGLLNMLTKEEVLDLLAYLESAGKK